MNTPDRDYPLRTVGHVFVTLLLSACSASSDHILAQYVPPEKYQALTCWEIGTEGKRVVSRVAEISGDEYPATSGTAWLVAPSIVVHWPTPWFATSEEAATELSKLKGEFEALEQAAALKRCGLSFKQQAG